ncbi:MAG: DNA-binding protein [Verrucomicrobia bacterium]|nr:DNA-binding protein [Verrucomicrobiota bacterium]
MKTLSRFAPRYLRVSLTLVTCAGVIGWLALAQNPSSKSKPNAAGNIKKVHRLGLAAGDLLLESIRNFIRDQKITDGAVLTGIGSLSECRLHWPKEPTYPPEDVFHTFKGALEIAAIQESSPMENLTCTSCWPRKATPGALAGIWKMAPRCCTSLRLRLPSLTVRP